MAFNDIENKRYEKIVSEYVERIRPDPSIRKQVDVIFRIQGQSVEILELRPHFRNPDEIMDFPIAKATYVRKHNLWKIFWQRADLKWHSYPPCPTVDSFKKFIDIVEKDEFACFWG